MLLSLKIECVLSFVKPKPFPISMNLRKKRESPQCTLKLDRREGGPELIIMFSDYDTTASKLSCDEIPLVQSFQPIGNELTFCVL